VNGKNFGNIAVTAEVADVMVSGSSWSPGFLVAIRSAGLGNGGYSLTANAGRASPLPWANLDQIKVRFAATGQQAQQAQLALRGAAGVLPAGTFAFDAASNTATWSLPAALRAERLTLTIGTATWTVNVLPGDVNRSGVVLADDFSEVKKKFFRSTTSPGTGDGAYSLFHDVDGSGSILANDFSEVKKRFFNRLPTAPAAAATAAASGTSLPVADIRSTTQVPPRRGLFADPPPDLLA
jgi:hypothetical protein